MLGWTYSYVTDLNFDLPQALVKDGILAPHGPAWKALVVGANQNISSETISRIRKLAVAGLPVIIAGEPGYYPGRSGCHETCFRGELNSLRDERNVHSVRQGQVAQKLRALGLDPQISSQNSSWYTTWRTCGATGSDYALLFNDGSDSSGKATFRTTKRPFTLDPWTGERAAVSNYSRGNGTITIPLALRSNQVKIFVFEAGEHMCHLSSGSPSMLAIESSNASISVHSRSNGEVKTSSGKDHALTSALPSFMLSNWSLTVSHWEHPSDIYDVETFASIRNSSHSLLDAELPSWTEITGLEDVSGVGYYTASFHWNFSAKASGAYISFPPIAHAITILVNGNRLPGPDYSSPLLHITPYLREGNNEVLAVVPSTMWNYLRTIMTKLRSGGEKSSLITRLGGNLPSRVSNGIVGNVQIIPYVQIDVRC